MSMPTVHVKREALLNMILSAAEVFKRECLGIVFGVPPTPNRNSFLVTNAIPLQSLSVRKYENIHQSDRSDKVLGEIFLKAKPTFRPLGDFHSHAERGNYIGVAEPSNTDIQDMKKDNTALSFIIAINSRKRGSALWEVVPDGGIRGSLLKFNFHINAYTLTENGDDEKIHKKLQIVAPSVLRALNRIHYVIK